MKFIGLIFAFLGLYCLAIGISMGIEGIKAKSWPTAKGRIIKSRVEELRTSSKIRIARLCLNLDYLYLVGNQVFEGHRLNSGWRCFASENYIKNILKKYPVGKNVLVHYNPQKPQISLLEPGLNWSVFLMIGLGLITISITYPIVKTIFRKKCR